jgi:periplasmic protein TonB
MSRPFTLPVVIAASVHAVLFLGFSPPPRMEPVKPTKPERAEPRPVLLAQDEEVAPPDPTETGAPEPRGRETSAPPSLADDMPNVAGLNPLTVEWKPKPADMGKPDMRNLEPGGGLENGSPGGARGRVGVSILKLGDLDDTPRAKAQASPVYPHHLRTAGISGEVVVEFIVNESGRVSEAFVVRSTQAEFEEPALRAVRTWRFEAGKRHGRPVKFRMCVPLVFSLTE